MLIRKGFLKRSAAAALMLGGATLVEAQGSNEGNVLELGDRTTQPIGHYNFCKTYPSECNNRYNPVPPVHLTPDMLRFIKDIDANVNASITPITDMDHWGKEEVWSFVSDGKGDCEEYVIGKRAALSARIHPANLLITVVLRENGEGHAVLVIPTLQGSLVVDNLKAPMFVSDSRYTFLKTIDPRNDGQWVSVLGKRDNGVLPSVATLNP